VGVGGLEKELRALAKDLGLEKDVYFLGWQSNPFKYMKRAAVFVLSSDYEGFGNVIVEAMASGSPVVSTDCHSGPGEILDGERFGILVPVGDDQCLAEEILKVLRSQEFRRRLSASGRVRAKEFDTHFISLSYVRLFNSLKDGTHERAARTSEEGEIQSGIQTE
jgi:glycosyltransferase involved in cell wall biosynthesis